MRNKMIKISTRVMASVLVAASVLSTATPVYAAENTAFVEEVAVDENTTVVEETPATEEVEGQGDVIDDEFAVSPEAEVQPATESLILIEAPVIDVIMNEVEGQGDIIDDEFAVAPSEVSEQTNSDTSEETQAGTTSVFCTSERLDEIAAMEISDPAIRAMRDRAVEADRSIFCAGLLKRYYLQKGPNLTFILGIYFIPSPIVYEIVQVIEHEVENGNRSYIYNGQFYASPEEDPTFNESLNR